MDQGLLPIYNTRGGQTQSTPPGYASTLPWTTQPVYQPHPNNSGSSNPTTPESFEGPYFALDVSRNQALMQQTDLSIVSNSSRSRSSISSGGSFIHSKSNSESGSSFEELTSPSFNNGLKLPATPITDPQVHHTATDVPQPASLSQRQFAHVVIAEHHRTEQGQGRDINQPLSHHLHPASVSASNRPPRFNYGSVIPTYMAPPPASLHNHHHLHHHHHVQQQQQLLQHHREQHQHQQQLNLTHAMRSFAFTPDFHSFNAFGDSSQAMTMGNNPIDIQDQASMLYGTMGNTDYSNNNRFLEVQDLYGMGITMDEQMKQYADNVPADLVGGGAHSSLSMGVGISMGPPTGQHGHGHGQGQGHGFGHGLGQGHGHTHGQSPATSLGMAGNATLGMAISQFGGRAQSRSSSTSTPSLACTSPQAIMSTPPMSSSFPTTTTSGPALFQSRQSAPPSLFHSNHSAPALFPPTQSTLHVRKRSEDVSSVNSIPGLTSAPAVETQNKNKTKKPRKPSSTAAASTSTYTSTTIATGLLSVAVEPLAARVAALPKDKKRLFEQACGDRWTRLLPPSEATTTNAGTPSSASTSGLDNEDKEALRKKVHADLMLLEVFFALIGSEELATQQEIPDSLVRPVLESVPLPKATAKKGSRGGAAGYKCLWFGCSKELIKRLDHAKNHVREHCRSKPHTCGGGGDEQGSRGCGQKFLRMDDLKRHQRSHCSVLRSGPGRRPRSVRGVHRDMDEDDEDRVEEEEEGDSLSSVHGGDDDDYRPVTRSATSSSATPSTRELATRLRNQRKRAAALQRRRAVSSDLSTVEDDDEDEEGNGRRLKTSHVRGAPMEGLRSGDIRDDHDHDDEDDDDDNRSDNSDDNNNDNERTETRMEHQEEHQEHGKAPSVENGEL